MGIITTMKIIKNSIVITFAIFIISFAFRFLGLQANHPFWIDEFSSVNQAQTVLKHGIAGIFDPQVYYEYHNIPVYLLIALFFKLLGAYEWTARLPFVLVGSLVPVLTFFLTRRVFNTRTAVAATLLTMCSYFEITWSRQARSYAIQQLLILASSYYYLEFITKSSFISIRNIVIFISLLILGILTHNTFFLFIGALVVHYVYIRRNELATLAKNPLLYANILLFGGILIASGSAQVIFNLFSQDAFGANNLWYYHSFLWREYGMITLLALIGMVMAFFTQRKTSTFLMLIVGFNLFFVCFIFKPYVTRYLASIFPLLLIFMAYALSQTVDLFIEKYKPNTLSTVRTIIVLGLIGFIIGNGHKFVLKPKQFYSVNHDFREVALIDYHQVYGTIKEKGKLSENKTAIIDTWPDRMYWYVGTTFPHGYVFNWEDKAATTNGLSTHTTFYVNKNGEKQIPQRDHLLFVSNVNDLKKVMQKYPRGFIYIDDSTMPADVIEYAEKNLKKELYLDHYPLDDNPYSIWPATLYSWGIEE